MSAIDIRGVAVLGPEDGKRVVPVPNSAIVFKAWGKRQAGDCDVAEFFLPPGNGPRPHVHGTYEHLFYVLEGDVEFLVAEQSLVLQPGSATFVPPGTVHGFRNSGTDQARFLLIASPSGLSDYFEEMAALSATGRLVPSAMTELRLKYDTKEVDAAWGTGAALT